MKTSTLHLFQPFSTPEWASSCLEAALPIHNDQRTATGSCVKVNLNNLILREQNAGKLFKTLRQHQVLSAAPRAERRGCRVAAAQWSEYVFLNDYVNLKSPGLETIQIYPADCILHTIYCIFKETGALYAYFSTSIHGKSSSSDAWMTFFFSQYNRLFILFILRVLSIINVESLKVLLLHAWLLTSRPSKCWENWGKFDIEPLNSYLSPGLVCFCYFAFLVHDCINLKEQPIFYFV